MAQDNLKIGTPFTTTGKGSLPASVQKTGTITSTGTRVVGTGTSFKTDLQPGDFIFNTTAAVNPAVRRVTHVLSDTHLILESAFPADVSGINFHRVRGEYKSIGVCNTGGAAGVFNEGPINDGVSPSFTAKDGFFVDPISYDATGTEFNFFTSKQ